MDPSPQPSAGAVGRGNRNSLEKKTKLREGLDSSFVFMFFSCPNSRLNLLRILSSCSLSHLLFLIWSVPLNQKDSNSRLKEDFDRQQPESHDLEKNKTTQPRHKIFQKKPTQTIHIMIIQKSGAGILRVLLISTILKEF